MLGDCVAGFLEDMGTSAGFTGSDHLMPLEVGEQTVLFLSCLPCYPFNLGCESFEVCPNLTRLADRVQLLQSENTINVVHVSSLFLTTATNRL